MNTNNNNPSATERVIHFAEQNVKIDSLGFEDGDRGLFSSDLYDRVYGETTGKYICFDFDNGKGENNIFWAEFKGREAFTVPYMKGRAFKGLFTTKRLTIEEYQAFDNIISTPAKNISIVAKVPELGEVS